MTAVVDNSDRENTEFPHWSVGKPGPSQLEHIPGESSLPGVGNTLKLGKEPVGNSLDMFRDFTK